MRTSWVFDAENYERLNSARAAVVFRLLEELGKELGVQSAIDVGCGLGYFTNLLGSLGLRVLGVDGRTEIVEEARRRFPQTRFSLLDVEDPAVLRLGPFDLVFCFGLLYHLENPLLAIRHLRAITKKLLLVEGLTYPGTDSVMALLDEASSEDQGLHHVAFYPTEACLVKMLYRAGFPSVYRVTDVPDHPEYREIPGWRKNRTVLAASLAGLRTNSLTWLPEPVTNIFPADPASGLPGSAVLNKIHRFLHRPLPMKLQAIKRLVGG